MRPDLRFLLAGALAAVVLAGLILRPGPEPAAPAAPSPGPAAPATPGARPAAGAPAPAPSPPVPRGPDPEIITPESATPEVRAGAARGLAGGLVGEHLGLVDSVARLDAVEQERLEAALARGAAELERLLERFLGGEGLDPGELAAGGHRLDRSIEEVLGPERFAAYLDARATRRSAERERAIGVERERLARALTLTADQRAALAEIRDLEAALAPVPADPLELAAGLAQGLSARRSRELDRLETDLAPVLEADQRARLATWRARQLDRARAIEALVLPPP